MTKKVRNKIDGLILLDKPTGISSASALGRVKFLLNAEKVGHTGTLDPNASGLLPICLGEATKFASFLLDGNKEYIATLKLGIVTDSGDSEGNIIAQYKVNTTLSQIKDRLTSFIGLQSQIPPMYSALKYQGVPLYKYARLGIEIPRSARKINIYELELINYNQELHELKIRALVSKGTYIRALAHDLGLKLKCGASLIDLRRTKTNNFILENTLSLEQLNLSTYLKYLLNINVMTTHLSSYCLTTLQFEKFKYGTPIDLNHLPTSLYLGEILQIFVDEKFIGVGCLELDGHQVRLKAQRLISGLS